MIGEPNLKGVIGKEHIPEGEVILRDFVGSIEPEVHVAIGAGSGFLYIGKARGFSREVPYIDFHFQYAAAKYFYCEGKASSYVPLLLRRVKKFWSRNIEDEPPMWCISIEGNEVGQLWLMCENEKNLKYKKEFSRLMLWNEGKLKEQ